MNVFFHLCILTIANFFLFLMINPYSVTLPKGRVYTDTRLGLEGVALFGYPYEDVKDCL